MLNNAKKEEHCSTLFFSFSSKETIEELRKRLKEAKQIGFYRIIASYKTDGMKPAKFDATYFEALDRLVCALREEQVSFWLEDYAPFPTGNANGAFAEAKHAEKNKLFIDERHIDISGPVTDAVIRIECLQSVMYGSQMHQFQKIDIHGRKRIGIVAYRMKENIMNAAAPLLEDQTGVMLDEFVQHDVLKWNVPEGHWRIFVLYETYESSGRAHFMNLLSKESVALEIEKVHKPLYEHLKTELGKTWIGFFYDEPEVGNAGGEKAFDFFMLPGRRTITSTDCNVFSWSRKMRSEMEKREPGWIVKLPCLWYDAIEEHQRFRYCYMDAVSSLIRENYNGQVYAFCQERGIHYIGHVLEDENCHTRLGCGPGHYFRQQYYQDEAGIDVIAGQILPGRDKSTSWYGVFNADGEFYHYGLAKLAASEAHINPIKKNRAVAECFAMYGQQGLAERKFLLDHLMVSGVNRMLMAELPSYQASSEYSKALVEYTDQICSLLRESRPVIKTAILYHAEAEWMEGDKAQKFQVPGAVLAKNQISYDVLPADVFAFAERYDTNIKQGLMVNGNNYEALIIPASSHCTEAVRVFVEHCKETGFPVFFVDRIPAECEWILEKVQNIRLVPISKLAEEVKQAITPDFFVESLSKTWIRYSHIENVKGQYYLVHNESPHEEADCELILQAENDVLTWDPMTDLMMLPEQEAKEDGSKKILLHLGQYEMKILYVPKKQEAVQEVVCLTETKSCKGEWEMEFPDGQKIKTNAEEMLHPEKYVGYDFYGKLIYRMMIEVDDQIPRFLDLGRVSDCCELFLNGKSIGMRGAAPYLYDVRNVIQKGTNELMGEVYTSAGNQKSPVQIFGIPMDCLTAVPYTLVEPMGIIGPVKWLY